MSKEKEKENFDLKEHRGKTNPIYAKDIDSNGVESIPSRRGSLERSRPPPYDPSDNSRGHTLESFGQPLEYNRNMERNFIKRDDGRVYHMIDDGGRSNKTLLYQPSRYQQSNGSVHDDHHDHREHSQPRYTECPRSHSVYDHIDTSREYKIARPNFGGRSRDYDY